MPKDKFCPSCDQLVQPKKNRDFMHPCLFIILCFFTLGIGGIAYLIYYYAKDKYKCPICGLTGLKEHGPKGRKAVKQDITISQDISQEIRQEKKEDSEAEINYCPNCGSRMQGDVCESCGTKIN